MAQGDQGDQGDQGEQGEQGGALKGLPVLLGLVLAAVICYFAWEFFKEGSGPIRDRSAARQGRCGTVTPSPAEQAAARDDVAAFLQGRKAGAAEIQLSIPVQFHVIHDGGTGNVAESVLRSQFAVLNDVFSPHGITFTWYAAPTRTDNKSWFEMELTKNQQHSPEEREAKTKLHVTPASVLNVYVSGTKKYLGWATSPANLASDPVMDGVVLSYQSLPGGVEPYHLGLTAVHEVGHWLGLLHIWAGGCGTHGDNVDDTPPQAEAREGCPKEPINSCHNDRPDVDDHLTNYMDYVDDACMDRFTPGQFKLMKSTSGSYRPALVVD